MNRVANILKHVSEAPPPSSYVVIAYLWWQCQVFCCVGVLDNVLFPLDKEADLQISKSR